MIKNEREYRITKSLADRFARTLPELEKRQPEQAESARVLQQAEEQAVKSQLADLRDQILEYEALREGRGHVAELRSIEDLPRVLIQTRIARGWSQGDLAARLGMKEQQVQRYEASDYSSASLARILEVARALDVGVEDGGQSRVPDLARLTKRLQDIGLNKQFVEKRLLPSSVSRRGRTSNKESLALRAASRLREAFGWSLSELSDDRPLTVRQPILVRFKAPKNRTEESLQSYASYAHYVTRLILKTIEGLEERVVPRDPYEVHNELAGRESGVSLEGLLDYVWSLGIPVIPLDDPGAFHGACFRQEGRNAIVVKQRVMSESRWMFDILHELWHTGEEAEVANWSTIDTEVDGQLSDEELVASQFAGAALLGTNPQKVAEACLNEASRDVRRLKSAVLKIASEWSLPADSVANYLAFRLSHEGTNWWGAAANLQSLDKRVWTLTRNKLLEKLDLSQLAEGEREFVSQALAPWEVSQHGRKA